MQRFLTLPSYSLLYKLSQNLSILVKARIFSHSVKVRENSSLSNDTVLLLDEMYLQREVQYDGKELTGCDSNLLMYKSILCFMVVSLKQSTPYIIKAIPLTKINHQVVQEGIINCISMLSRGDFNVRAVVSDNHSTNVSAYKHLKAIYPFSVFPVVRICNLGIEWPLTLITMVSI